MISCTPILKRRKQACLGSWKREQIFKWPPLFSFLHKWRCVRQKTQLHCSIFARRFFLKPTELRGCRFMLRLRNGRSQWHPLHKWLIISLIHITADPLVGKRCSLYPTTFSAPDSLDLFFLFTVLVYFFGGEKCFTSSLPLVSLVSH